MGIDNYLYFSPVTKTGKKSDWFIQIIDFHSNIRVHNWFKKYERVTVNVLRQFKKDIERVVKNIELGDELFPDLRYTKGGDGHYKFDGYDLDILIDFGEKLDEIIDHQDCIGKLRYFAW